MGVSGIVLTRDEADDIVACLAGLSWAEEVLVLDSGSQDATRGLAAEAGARVEMRPFDTFPRQRNAALELARQDWVLFVDADERVSPQLATELQGAAATDLAGYWIPRKNLIFGRWIRGGGWWPDHQLRLFRREKGRYDEARSVHEVVMLEGREGYLTNPLLHHNYRSVSQFLEKQRRYTDLAVRDLWQEGIRSRPWSPILQAWREFRRRFISLRGYRDGVPGLTVAVLLAWYEGTKYVRLGRMRAQEGIGQTRIRRS